MGGGREADGSWGVGAVVGNRGNLHVLSVVVAVVVPGSERGWWGLEWGLEREADGSWL